MDRHSVPGWSRKLFPDGCRTGIGDSARSRRSQSDRGPIRYGDYRATLGRRWTLGAALNTIRSGSRSSCRLNHAQRRLRMSERSCSLAWAVFFAREAPLPGRGRKRQPWTAKAPVLAMVRCEMIQLAGPASAAPLLREIRRPVSQLQLRRHAERSRYEREIATFSIAIF